MGVWDMRVSLLIFLIMGLVCLIGGAVANDLANSTITSTQTWVIANGNSQSTITVTALDSNHIPQSGIPVTFYLDPNSTVMGKLSPLSGSTDSYGMASTTFTANKISGSATININLTYNGNITHLVYVQLIDHDVPFYWTVTSPAQATVGTETDFNVSYTDQWGNVIDHRNPADPNTVSLQIGSVSGNAAFDMNGNYVTSTTQQLDGYGNLSVKVRLDYIAGQNNIYIQPFGAITGVYPAILGIANGIPASISLTTSPSPPDVPADMAHTVSITYILYDKFGNPTMGQNISVQTSAGDYYPGLTSNNFGYVGLTYGPQATAENITITATAVSNTSVTCSENVTFYSTAPVNFALAADPQTMPSLDVNSNTKANITAQVTDVMGNPVAGQTVTFSLGAPSYDKVDNVTSLPALTATNAVTDGNGNAIVQFIPGGFSTVPSTSYNPTATGNCFVTATWNGTQQSVLLTWKNYPYLSAFTSVSPSTIPVNGTVNVTVKLTGDGWALTTNPVDVVLLFDRSGSMGDCLGSTGSHGSCPGGTELANAQTAAEKFGVLMNASNDRIAVVSFAGNNNNIDTTVNQILTTNHAAVNTSITNLVASGNTGTLDGLYQSISLLKANPNSNPRAVRAIVLLTDGDYNWLGNYLGRGTGYYPPPPNGYTNYNNPAQQYMYYQGLGGDLTGPSFAPTAYFTATGESGNRTAGGGVTFNDGSSNSPASYSWNFGDGGTSTSQNPFHVFSQQTNYTVTEKVTNSAGSNTSTRTAQISWSYKNNKYNTNVNLIPSVSPPTSTSGYDTCTDGVLTAQNMSVFAVNNNIRVFTIAYASSSNFQQQSITDMNILANATGGMYAAAPDAATLAQVYSNIAGNLQTAAGVNATMSLNFGNVNVTGVTVPGVQVLSYVHNNSSTNITWQDGITNNTDQSGQWPNLQFNVGTINLGQTWQAIFQLKVLEGGSIQLFGNSSTITFNNGASSMTLPPAYFTALANLTNTGVTTQSILLSPLLVTKSGIITDFVPLQWSTTYPGSGLYTATERLYYTTAYLDPQTCGASPWVQFDQQTGIPVGESNEYSSLDVRILPQGTYYICVLAQAPDANQAIAETGSATQVKMSGKSYIKLE
jgi:hypothetical protein